MSQQQRIHEQSHEESTNDGSHYATTMASNASMVGRAQAIQQLNTWLKDN